MILTFVRPLSRLIQSTGRRLVALATGQNTHIHGTMLLAASIFVAIWYGYVSTVNNEKSLALEGARDSSRNIASIIAANLDEVLGRATIYSQIAASYVDGNEAARLLVNPLEVGDGAYLRAAVFDPAGNLLYSSSGQHREPELAPLVERMRAMQAARMLVGDPPGAGARAWRLPIAVPLAGREHGAGYYAALVDIGYFLRRYRDVKLGDGGSIAILHRNGAPIAVLRGGALLEAGAAVAPESGFSRASLALKAPDEGGRYASSAAAAVPLAQWPVQIAVVADTDDVLGKLAARHDDYRARAIGFSVLVGLVSLGVLVGLRRQQRLHWAVAESEQEKLKLIDLLEQEKQRVYELASNDYLTGIPNRRLFHELAASELARAKRSRNLYALLFFDLDRFKLVNDTLGHAVGDLLLKAVAARLRETLRAYDLVARLGGDEFVVLLSEIPSEEFAGQLASKLVAELSRPYPDLGGHRVETSPSVGIALYPRDGESVEELLMHADQAMYTAKARGRGVYRFYDASLNASSARRFELSARFRGAVEGEEFCLHYQPRVDLDTLQVAGVEALVRWEHPEHGMIYPGEFIGLAEDEGYIVQLGQWILEAVCRQISDWRARGIPLVPVAINVSVRQLREDSFPTRFISTLERHGVAPDCVEIEITESCFIEDPEQAQHALEQLAARGIRIALDDFGTGFSGLARLKQLPIDMVKIDRSFIRDIRNDTNDAVIVSSTISLAHNLGLTVVAEGVESSAQLVHLKAAGCDQAQGFFLQRPAPARDVESLLGKRFFTFPQS